MTWRDLIFLNLLGGGGVSVDSAKVGQTIVVKSIDGDGKPTEWEAVELPKEEVWEHICDIIPDGTTPVVTQIFEHEYKKIEIIVTTSASTIVSGSSTSYPWCIGVMFGSKHQNIMFFHGNEQYRTYIGTAELLAGTVAGLGYSGFNKSALTAAASVPVVDNVPAVERGMNGVTISGNREDFLVNVNTFKVYGVKM